MTAGDLMINKHERNQVRALNETIDLGVPKHNISDPIADMDVSNDIPLASQKIANKIERSSSKLLVSHGSRQAQRSLVVG